MVSVKMYDMEGLMFIMDMMDKIDKSATEYSFLDL